MKFDQKTLNGTLIADKTECDFEVKTAEDYIAKSSGNESIKVVVQVFAPNGEDTTITDYIAGGKKLKAMCVLAGVDPDAGELRPESIIGLAGRCMVNIDKDATGQYPDKNVIRYYIAPTNGTTAPKSQDDPATLEAARRSVWGKFKGKTANMSEDQRKGAWTASLAGYGPAGGPKTAADWVSVGDKIQRFGQYVKEMAPDDAPPIKDDDIPF